MAKRGRKPGTPKTPGTGRDFKPGQSGNPGGFTSEQIKTRRLFSEALGRELQSALPEAAWKELVKKYPGLKKGATWNDANVFAAVFEGALGNVSAHVHNTDRLEGKVKQQIDVRNVSAYDDETLNARIAELEARDKAGEEKPN